MLKRGICCGVIFILLIAMSSLLIAWPQVYRHLLKTNLVLSPTSKSYGMWVETPLPMFLDVYIFNWKNAEDFVKNPKLNPAYEEIGPFVFREVHDRVNITWNDDGTVTYNQTRKWTLVPELSMDINTPITNLDVITLGAAHATRYSSTLVQEALNTLLRVLKSKPYVTKPAKEWLFDGMNLPILKVLNNHWIKGFLPFDVPDKFGFFYQRNMSAAYDGRFSVLTGADELTELGNLKLWNSKNRTDFFKGDCAIVNGSSGEIFAPLKNGQDELTLFITDVCSSLMLKYEQEETYGDLVGKKFIGDATMFDNGQNISDRGCFCEGECQPAGVRNLTRCRQGAPVFVSFPHFYLADSSYLTGIDGLSPNKSLHEFKLTLDPVSGIPLDVRAALQVNVLLQDYKMYNLYHNMPKVYMPMIWFAQRAHITKDMDSQVWVLDNLNTTISTCFAAVIGILCSIVLVWFIHCWVRKCRTKDDEEPLIEDAEENND